MPGASLTLHLLTLVDTLERVVPPRLSTAALAVAKRAAGEVELARLPEWVPPGRPAMDVGASRGVYTWFLRRLAPEVHAVEPNPRLAARLVRAFPDVRVHAVALSDREGTARLRVPRLGRTPAEGWATLEARADFPGLGRAEVEEIEVPVTTLDRLALADVGFLKIDVEGHEAALLHGGMETLRRCRPVILLECGGGPESEAGRLLAGLGYRMERAGAPFMWLARPAG